MPDEKVQGEKSGPGSTTAPGPMPKRALDWTLRVWRPAGTVVAVCLTLLLTWHVVNGKHGLSVWQHKRAEDQQLQKEINDLEQENAQLRKRVERLKSDPDAIEHEAREKLHYAKPGEVIYALPAQTQTQTPPTGAGK
ncbi:MAG: septum formation initiator family protein [Terracidiphilus sp.]|jgi:cell division protein FtsB